MTSDLQLQLLNTASDRVANSRFLWLFVVYLSTENFHALCNSCLRFGGGAVLVVAKLSHGFQSYRNTFLGYRLQIAAILQFASFSILAFASLSSKIGIHLREKLRTLE
jgi:hypothetical protein